jgi:hypothetical protein
MCRLAIYRLDHELGYYKKGICGTQIPAEYGPLSRGPASDHEFVEVESGGGHPWRSPHRISLLLS